MTDYLPGSFFLTRISGATGYAIQLAQALVGDASRWTHAGLILEADGTILEAEPGGARISNLSEYIGRPLYISDAPVQRWLTARAPWASPKGPEWSEDYIRGAAVREARKLEGIPYSALDYAALALLHLHLPSGWVRRRVETSGHLICSALVDRVYMNAGISLYDDGRLVGDVMPSDLAALAEDWQAGE